MSGAQKSGAQKSGALELVGNFYWIGSLLAKIPCMFEIILNFEKVDTRKLS